MPASITEIVNVRTTTDGALPERTSVNTLGVVHEHTITRNRYDGPFFSEVEANDAGFTLETAPEVIYSIRAALNVELGVASVRIGRKVPAAGDPVGAAITVDTGTGATDRTAAARSETAADVVVFPATEAVDDFLLLGHEIPASSVRFDYAGGTAGVGGAVAWEYWNGASWVAFENVTDPTVGFTAAAADDLRVTFTRPLDWVAVAATGIEQPAAAAALGDDESEVPRYWMRARVTTIYGTNPVITRILFGGDASFAVANAEIDALHGADWAYGLTIASRVAADIEGGRAHVAARTGMFFGQTADNGVRTGASGNIGETTHATSSRKGGLVFHRISSGSIDAYADVAMASRVLGADMDTPGGFRRVHMKTLANITPDNHITPAQALIMHANAVNTYTSIKSIPGLLHGTTFAGPPFFFDITLSLDWLVLRVEEDWAAFLNANDPGMTIAGAAAAREVVLNRVLIGVTNGIFAPFEENPPDQPFAIVMPTNPKTEMSSIQRQTRNISIGVNNLFFTGGIQSADITFNMSF